MKSLRQFREENGLGDIKPTSDVSGPESELLNDLSTLFRDKGDFFIQLLHRCLRDVEGEDGNEVKKLIGIIGHLKDAPPESKEKMRDPLDNVVVRPHNGADGSNGGTGGGE